MILYKVIIAYEGTNYYGWQEQEDVPTVCGTLKNSFKETFNQDISIVGASRTDAGVHAHGQVARIRTTLRIDPDHLATIWNRTLPEDIVIRSIHIVDETFHPQNNVEEKTYVYKVFTKKPLPTHQRFGLFYDFPVNMEKLHDALQLFVGTHDFRSFCTGYDMKSTIRTINSITLKQFNYDEHEGFDIIFKGESFLRYMIRRLVGASLEISSKNHLNLAILEKALAEKNPQQSLKTAEPKGLMLYSITYKD